MKTIEDTKAAIEFASKIDTIPGAKLFLETYIQAFCLSLTRQADSVVSRLDGLEGIVDEEKLLHSLFLNYYRTLLHAELGRACNADKEVFSPLYDTATQISNAIVHTLINLDRENYNNLLSIARKQRSIRTNLRDLEEKMDSLSKTEAKLKGKK